MTIIQLLKILAKHYVRAVELNGNILAEENFAADERVLAANGTYGPYWTVIGANAEDVRNWLGY
jgi:hypothetical protein